MTVRAFLLPSFCALLGLLLYAQQIVPPAKPPLVEQFHFESKIWPNLHHFLYVLARARNGARDRNRVAVRNAPLDVAGFDNLPEAQRNAWEDAIAIYQRDAAPLDIAYGKLVDTNYALADLPAGARLDQAHDIPEGIRSALAQAEPVYRTLWWPRHDAANQAWVKQLRPQIEQYGTRIVQQLTTAFQHPWPNLPLRVEVVAYAQWAGAYTTEDPPLITMSSLNEEHRGADGLEELFHECSHLIMGTVDEKLKAHAKAAGKELSRDVSHSILFYTVGAVLERTVPEHIPYAVHYGVWERGWTKNHELLKLDWQPYLDGRATMDEALDRIVREL